MIMSGAENFHIAPMTSRTGFPVFIEFVSLLIKLNDPKDNVIELIKCLNDIG